VNLREVIVDLCPHGYMGWEDPLQQHWALAFRYTTAYYHWYTVYLDSTDSPRRDAMDNWVGNLMEHLQQNVLPRVDSTRSLRNVLTAVEEHARRRGVTFTRRAA
jgi:hypothetical protein